MRKLFTLLIIIVFTFFSSCKKRAHKQNPELVGEWMGNYLDGQVYISIREKGISFFDVERPDAGEGHTQGFARSNGTKLRIGYQFMKILEPPRKIDTNLVKDYFPPWHKNGKIKEYEMYLKIDKHDRGTYVYR